MDVGDITDPNLDGDFQALVEIRQKRSNITSNQTAIQQLLSLHEVEDADTASEDRGKGPGIESHETAAVTKKLSSVPTVTVDADQLRTLLLDAVTKNDVSAMKAACKKVAEAGLSLTDQVLRDPLNDATILHTALIDNKWDVGKYLIQSNKDEKLLDDVFKVTVRKLSSKKTCLHILAENGQYELTRIMLDQFTDTTRRTAFVDAVVLTELEGQRPRDLASIHLASLKGHTSLVQLLLDSGVDVNCTNIKKDTPVLWAARGNHIETVRLLISRGANLQLENDKGSTPLYWAVRYGFTELAKLLITEGKANIHQRRKDVGLVTPIVVAAALGHRDIIDVLLDNGADVEARIGNGTTALHAAAFEGNDDVIELLVTKGHALVDQTDTAGNTALLCAAKVGNVATMNLLVTHGASIDAQNKLGETIWHYAIRQDDDTLLKAIAGLYRKAKGTDRGMRTIKFAAGRNPLQVAVAAGRVDKVRCLLKVGADPKTTDLNGNTFYHLAARDGKTEVVQAFIDEVDLASVNSDGDTPLHLAAKSGNIDVVKLLLTKSKLDARDKLGMTPLHEAVGSEAAVPEVIRIMIDVIVKANNWSLVNAVDVTGNTALHVAARRGNPDVLREMAALNARARNRDGDTPFHLSARGGHPYSVETMLQIFNRPEKGFNVDEMTTGDGHSALHICAARGDWQRVELLAIAGADLSLQDTKGNTPLHVVVEESIKEPSMIEAFLQVIRTFVRCATRWWCTTNDRQLPTDESELFYAEMRAAVVHLTSEVFNADGLNVVGLATLRGSVPIVEELLNTPNVYRFREQDAILYDVTYLTPFTTPTAFARRKLKTPVRETSATRIGGKKSSSAVGVLDDVKFVSKSAVDAGEKAVVATASAVVGPTTVSCLELIVSIPDEILAARLLEVAPYRQLVRNQWSGYQWIYVLLMLIHVAYMTLYSVFAIPSNSTLFAVYNVTSSTSCRSFTATPELFGLFLIWPSIIVVFMIYYTLSNLIRYAIKTRRSWSAMCSSFRLIDLPFQILSLLFNYLDQLSALAFGALVITWYVLYRCGTTAQAYVQVSALVFIIGWLFTLNFTKGFEAMHSFSVMLKWIIIRDITRFLLMYIFVLLGFGLAFQALFQLSTTLSSEYGTVWNTLFTVFNLMLGLGNPLDSNFDSTYSTAGGNSAFVYWVYIIYIAVASIIMMNLLVAMMSDTFANIKSNEGTTWKVGSLQLGLRIERSFPVLQKLLRCSGRDPVFFDSVAGRWMISVPSGTILSRFGESVSKEESIDAMLKVIQRLEAKVDRVQVAQGELTQQVDAVTEAVRKGGDIAVSGTAGLVKKPMNSLYNVAMTVRQRPKSGAFKRSQISAGPQVGAGVTSK